MISVLKSWLIGILAAALGLSLLDAITPRGAIKGVMKVTGGLVIFLALWQPLSAVSLDDLEWKYREQAEALDREIARYRGDYLDEMENIIAEEVAAYISDKAAQSGIRCRVKVETEMQDAIPVPASVWFDIPKEEALAAWIANELGIDADRQYWEEDI